MKLLHTKKQAFYKGMNICSVRAQIESLKSFKIVYFGSKLLFRNIVLNRNLPINQCYNQSCLCHHYIEFLILFYLLADFFFKCRL